jgi:hypothetical protein
MDYPVKTCAKEDRVRFRKSIGSCVRISEAYRFPSMQELMRVPVAFDICLPVGLPAYGIVILYLLSTGALMPLNTATRWRSFSSSH